MIAATCALIFHAFPIALGLPPRSQRREELAIPPGTIAVGTFFAISGFLISRSYDRSKRIVDRMGARVARFDVLP